MERQRNRAFEKQVGLNLEAIRGRLSYSRKDMAAAMNVTESRYTRLARGNGKIKAVELVMFCINADVNPYEIVPRELLHTAD